VKIARDIDKSREMDLLFGDSTRHTSLSVQWRDTKVRPGTTVRAKHWTTQILHGRSAAVLCRRTARDRSRRCSAGRRRHSQVQAERLEYEKLSNVERMMVMTG
jgi:hypothetical protein